MIVDEPARNPIVVSFRTASEVCRDIPDSTEIGTLEGSAIG